MGVLTEDTDVLLLTDAVALLFADVTEFLLEIAVAFVFTDD